MNKLLSVVLLQLIFIGTGVSQIQQNITKIRVKSKRVSNSYPTFDTSNDVQLSTKYVTFNYELTNEKISDSVQICNVKLRLPILTQSTFFQIYSNINAFSDTTGNPYIGSVTIEAPTVTGRIDQRIVKPLYTYVRYDSLSRVDTILLSDTFRLDTIKYVMPVTRVGTQKLQRITFEKLYQGEYIDIRYFSTNSSNGVYYITRKKYTF